VERLDQLENSGEQFEEYDIFAKLSAETGLDDAIRSRESAAVLINAVTAKIREARASTFAGSYQGESSALRPSASRDYSPGQNWEEQVMGQFIIDLEKLVASSAT
jgi:hypothetical protein